MSQLKSLEYLQKKISIKNIALDLENPRYNDKLIERGYKKWTDKELQEVIEEEDVAELTDSIRELGVKDPVWVIGKGRNSFTMIEGSRRLVVLRGLLRQKAKAPRGISYEIVKANVLPSNISQKEIDAQRVILQTGKKKWEPFNVASAIYNLVKNDHYTIEEVATMMQESVSFCKKELASYQLYIQFKKFMKKKKIQEDPRKYTYFQRAGTSVVDKFFGTQAGKEKFFGLITPNEDGITRIPTVALQGGLMNFNTIAQNENILKKFLKDKRVTVLDALDDYKGLNIQSSLPWIKKLKDVAKGLNQLGTEDMRRIKKDSTVFTQIKRIYAGSKAIVESKD